jgi:Uma2 family endonuclease
MTTAYPPSAPALRSSVVEEQDLHDEEELASLEAVGPFRFDIDPIQGADMAATFAVLAAQRYLRVELEASGRIVVMSPAASETGRINAQLSGLLAFWAVADGTGYTFDSSAGFTLASGAVRSPDAAWISSRRYEALSPAQRATYSPICPDFVVELLSGSDSLRRAKNKMTEWMAAGARLGWLVDAATPRAWVYRAGTPAPEAKEGPEVVLSGEVVLPGFELDLGRLQKG